jgi:O-antigen ligase
VGATGSARDASPSRLVPPSGFVRPLWIVTFTIVVGMTILFDPGGADVFMLPKVALIAAGVTVAGALVAIGAGERRLRITRPAIAPAVAVLLAVSAAATAVSSRRLLATIGLTERFGGFLSLVVFVGLGALVMTLAAHDTERLSGVAYAFVAAAGVAALYAVFQQAGIDRYHFVEASGAPTRFPGSTLGNSNFLGGQLAIVVPLLVMLAFAERRPRVRGGLLALGGLIVAGLWIAQSRGGMLAAGIGVAVVVLLAPGLPRAARIAAAGGGALFVAGVFVSAALIIAPGFRSLPGPFRHLEVLRTDSTDVRGFEWSAAWRITLHHPLLGTGPDTFAVEYPRYRSRADGAQLGLLLSDKPHNVLLESAADTGVLGLGAYLAVLALVGVAVVRRRRESDARERLLLAGFTAAFVAYIAQALFSIDVPPLAASGWILLGALVALADPRLVASRAAAATAAARRRLPGRAGAPKRERPPRANPWLRVGAAGVAALLLAGIGFPIVGSWREHLAIGRDSAAALDRASSAYDAAITANPPEASYREAAGFFAERRAESSRDRAQRKHFLAVAQARYDEALARRPGSATYLVDLARVETIRAQTVDTQDFAEADRRWVTALAADPNDWEIRNLRALALAEWANATGGPREVLERAASGFEAVVAIQPDLAVAWGDLIRVEIAIGDRARVASTVHRAAVALHFDFGALARFMHRMSLRP